MRIVPAVDIRGGRCVNLVQGDYTQETVFAEDPVAQAKTWWERLLETGAARDTAVVHIVDLDGARAGQCCVEPQLRAMAQAGITFEVGGGIRNPETVDTVFEAGAERVILGTAAHQSPALLEAACRQWPGQIAVGIDARDGRVALSGWEEDTRTDAAEFARRVEAAGAARIIYTDILRDGMMQGPNFEATAAIAQSVAIPVTLSGGVSRLEDIRGAAELAGDGVDEVIIGRALYLKAFTLAEAVAAAWKLP